jgi:hypothetical protein
MSHHHEHKENTMSMIENELRTRPGKCPTHGDVTARKEVPKVKFPFIITGVARGLAATRPYRCPACGAKAAAA